MKENTGFTDKCGVPLFDGDIVLFKVDRCHPWFDKRAMSFNQHCVIEKNKYGMWRLGETHLSLCDYWRCVKLVSRDS